MVRYSSLVGEQNAAMALFSRFVILCRSLLDLALGEVPLETDVISLKF